MDKIKQELKRYKWILISGILVALITGILAANIHLIQFMHYRLQGDTASIIKLLSQDIKNERRQKSWYFRKGIEYLLEEASEENLIFLEEHLQNFDADRQYEIIEGYNQKNLLFKDHKTFMSILMSDLYHESAQNYLKRITPEVLDQELFYYFGEKPVVDQNFIDTLYDILSVYPKILPLEYFRFSIYPILILEGEIQEPKKVQIFSKIEPSRTKTILFQELKTEAIDLDVLATWMELLKKYNILDTQEYAGFTNLYTEIQVMRNQYKRLDESEVDLINKKQLIEVELGDKLKLLEENGSQIAHLEYETVSLEKELEKLTDYAHMALYIDKAYGNNEYEASVPRKNLFGNYKSSSQKYVLKLNNTSFYQEGVYYVDVYVSGTKNTPQGKEYPYYIEVSNENLERIALLSRNRTLKVNELSQIKIDTEKLQTQVELIKAQTGYDENEKALYDLQTERETLTKKLDSKIIEIKNLLGLGNITRR